MGLFDLFKKKKEGSTALKDKCITPPEPNQFKPEGEKIEFLIKGDLEISTEIYDQIMTPNSFAWTKIQKGNWPYYQIDQADFNYSSEPPSIQMTFDGDITFQKAKDIADEIIDNIQATGQSAHSIVLNSGKVYKFKNWTRTTKKHSFLGINQY